MFVMTHTQRRNKMEESIKRELIRFQDILADIIPLNLFYKWAIVNEEVIEYLDEKEEKE